MIASTKHIYGHYDKNGVWQRDKFCFIQCPPDQCDCMPPNLTGEIMKQKTEYDIAMEEFLANGGQIQQIAWGVQSETATTNFWGSPKKKAKVEETEAVEEIEVDVGDDVVDEDVDAGEDENIFEE